MWWLSGIFRDVELIGEPKDGVEDIYVVTDLDKNYINANLKFNLKLKTTNCDSVSFELVDKNENLVF